MDIVFDEMDVDRGFILIKKDGQDDLIPKAIRFRHKPKDPKKITVSRTIINHVVKRCEGVLCTNAMGDQRFTSDNQEDSIYRYGLTSVICVPIIAHRQVHGVIHLDSSMSEHTYSTEQLRLANAFGHMTGMALENAKLVRSRMQNERLAATGETVAFLSHHIKNVLQGLRSGGDVLELGLKNKSFKTIEQGWQILDRSLEKVFNLTTNMLTFSKDRTPCIQRVQLNQIITDIVAATQPQADQKSVMIFTELEESPEIQVGLHGVQQVVLNLLLNAVDAVPEQTGRINLRTEYDAKSRSATFIISDNGPGIPPELMTRIFEPFFSTKGHAGTGLGLAAANKVVQELHGRIDVQSNPDQGTTFRVVFPDWNKTEPTDTDQVS